MNEQASQAFVQGKTAQRISAALLFLVPLSLVVYPDLGSTWTGLVFLWGLILWALPGDRPRLERREHWFLWSSFGLFAVAALSLSVALDFDEGVSDLGRYAHFLLLVPLYLGLRRQGAEWVTPLVWGATLACLGFAGWAWYEVGEYGWSWRRAGGLYNPIPFGQYAAMSLCLSFGLLQRRLWWPLLAVAVFSGLYAVAMSQTRGVWLALVFTPLIVAFLFFHSRGKLVVGTVTMMLAVVVVWGGVAGWPGFNRIIAGVSDLRAFWAGSESCTSLGLRLQMWQYVILFWQHHPLLGSGLGGYSAAVNWLGDREVILISCQLVVDHHAHSNLFQVLMVMGVLGLLAFVNWFLAAGAAAYHHPRGGVRALALATVSIVFMFGLSEAWLAKSLSVKFFLIVMVALLASKGMGKDDTSE